MKDYNTILKDLGIEVPADKADELRVNMNANYRTIEDYRNATTKRDEYKASLDKYDGIDVDDLKQQLANEKAGRVADRRASEIAQALAGKHFVNQITADSIKAQMAAAMEKDDKLSAADVLKSLTTDDKGADLPDIFKSGIESEEKGVKFSQKKHESGGDGKTVYKSKAEIMAIKNTAKRRQAMIDNPQFFGRGKK